MGFTANHRVGHQEPFLSEVLSALTQDGPKQRKPEIGNFNCYRLFKILYPIFLIINCHFQIVSSCFSEWERQTNVLISEE